MRAKTIAHLFAYGTLRRNGGSKMVARLEREAKWKGLATLAGRLVDLGAYPGLLPASNPSERVHGDLWQLPADPALLDELDRYERCHPADPEPHEYVRIVCAATGEDGVRIWTWTYLYVLPHSTRNILPGGDWQNRKTIAKFSDPF